MSKKTVDTFTDNLSNRTNFNNLFISAKSRISSLINNTYMKKMIKSQQ